MQRTSTLTEFSFNVLLFCFGSLIFLTDNFILCYFLQRQKKILRNFFFNFCIQLIAKFILFLLPELYVSFYCLRQKAGCVKDRGGTHPFEWLWWSPPCLLDKGFRVLDRE